MLKRKEMIHFKRQREHMLIDGSVVEGRFERSIWVHDA